MHRRHFLQLSLAAACSALSPAVLADDVSEALQRIAKARASVKTLQGTFKQKRIIGLLASAVDSKGELTMVSPDRLRWELKPPDSVTYFVGPKGLAIVTGDGVTKVGKTAAGRFAAVLGDLMIMLGGDLSKLRTRYELSVTKKDKNLVLKAKPKHKDVAKHVALLTMEAGPELWQIQRVEIEERNGDRSIIRFDRFKRNQPVKPAYMKPPE
jgi:outer membrane lipoprotein-sorting protein